MIARSYLVPAGVTLAQVELPAGCDTRRKGSLHLRPATVEELTDDELRAVKTQRPEIARRLVAVSQPSSSPAAAPESSSEAVTGEYKSPGLSSAPKKRSRTSWIRERAKPPSEPPSSSDGE